MPEAVAEDDEDEDEDDEDRVIEYVASLCFSYFLHNCSRMDSGRNQPLSRYEVRQQRLREEQARKEEDERIRSEEWDRIKKDSKEKQKEYRARQEVSAV
jgi:hypothetical protein